MCWQQGKANRIKHQCPTSASGLWSQPRCLQEVQTAGTTDRLSTTHLPLDGATNGLSYPQRRPTEPNSTWTFQPTGESPGGVWWIDPGGGSSVPTWYPAFFHSQPGWNLFLLSMDHAISAPCPALGDLNSLLPFLIMNSFFLVSFTQFPSVFLFPAPFLLSSPPSPFLHSCTFSPSFLQRN